MLECWIIISVNPRYLTCAIDDAGCSQNNKCHCIGCQNSTQKNVRKFTTCSQFHQHVYAQLLRKKIPKAQKENKVNSVFLCFLDLQTQKLLVKCDEIETWSHDDRSTIVNDENNNDLKEKHLRNFELAIILIERKQLKS